MLSCVEVLLELCFFWFSGTMKVSHSPYLYSISEEEEEVQNRLRATYPRSKEEIRRLWFIKWDEEHAIGIGRCFLVAMPIDNESI